MVQILMIYIMAIGGLSGCRILFRGAHPDWVIILSTAGSVAMCFWLMIMWFESMLNDALAEYKRERGAIVWRSPVLRLDCDFYLLRNSCIGCAEEICNGQSRRYRMPPNRRYRMPPKRIVILWSSEFFPGSRYYRPPAMLVPAYSRQALRDTLGSANSGFYIRVVKV